MKKMLPDTLAGWLRLAVEKQVYVEYRFFGAVPGLYAVSPAVAWLHPGMQMVFRREEENIRLEVKARNSLEKPQTEKPG